MSHKADKQFFSTKRVWSKRKDTVLEYYLVPYLTKIAARGKPVLIVDGFAGPGAFLDGEPGSPLIIQGVVERTLAKNVHAEITCSFVESDDELFALLEKRIHGSPGYRALHGKFLDVLPQIERCARTHSVFLYVDPYTVEGLEWKALDSVFRYVDMGDYSVEVLLNFNADSFARRGLAALKRNPPAPSEMLPDPDPEPLTAPEVKHLNEIIGGDWWQTILLDTAGYAKKVETITNEFCRRLSDRFAEVFVHEIKQRAHHVVPKYVLVFASRHPDTRALMNDAMCKSRDMFAEEHRPLDETLFETRPVSLVPEKSRIPDLILKHLSTRMERKELIRRILGEVFAIYSTGELKTAINEMVKAGSIGTDHPKPRLNDDAAVWPKVGRS